LIKGTRVLEWFEVKNREVKVLEWQNKQQEEENKKRK